jgi:hypothetical protein
MAGKPLSSDCQAMLEHESPCQDNYPAGPHPSPMAGTRLMIMKAPIDAFPDLFFTPCFSCQTILKGPFERLRLGA